MSAGHLSPGEALEAHHILGAQTSVAMHYGTFRMGDDGQTEAVERLKAAIEKKGRQQTEFWILDFGEGRDLLPMGSQIARLKSVD
jgi:L-ascorbate metabolism protein UlaG (beta-lactamase superfamily)